MGKGMFKVYFKLNYLLIVEILKIRLVFIKIDSVRSNS